MGAENIYQHAWFNAYAAVDFVRRYIITVPFSDYFFLFAYGHFESPAFYIGHLRMMMLVKFANSANFKLYFYKHNFIVIAIHLSFYSVTQIFPWSLVFKLK